MLLATTKTSSHCPYNYHLVFLPKEEDPLSFIVPYASVMDYTLVWKMGFSDSKQRSSNKSMYQKPHNSTQTSIQFYLLGSPSWRFRTHIVPLFTPQTTLFLQIHTIFTLQKTTSSKKKSRIESNYPNLSIPPTLMWAITVIFILILITRHHLRILASTIRKKNKSRNIELR